MGALHLAHVRHLPTRTRRRGGGGGDDGEPPYIIPSGSCEPCREHLHHKCHGANLLDEQRPDCPCPCDDPTDPTGLRMGPRAWNDLARHRPDQIAHAVTLLRLRETGAVWFCAWRADDSGMRSAR